MAQDKRTASVDVQGGPYLATVISHLDTKYMGGLEVELLKLSESGNTTSGTGQILQVGYLPAFFGATPYKDISKNEGFKNTQKSYGLWAVPPDIGTTVLVIFVEGNRANGFWIGCVPDEFMNYMVPGNPATTYNSDDRTKMLPVGEYNKRQKQKGQDPTQFVKPVNTDFKTVLDTNGLISDTVRGVSTSSARRELPSAVFGWSTPGPYDRRPKAPKGKYGKAGEQITIASSRLGGSSFVMDDGDASLLRKGPASTKKSEYVNVEAKETGGDPTLPSNELIRLRTRTGHQILLHNTEDLIYIGSANGKTWLELTSNGKIDVYATDSVSIHTENDLNVTAKRDINLDAKRDINLRAARHLNGTAGFTDEEIEASRQKHIPDRFEEGEIHFQAQNTFYIQSLESAINVKSEDSTFVEAVGGSIQIKAKANTMIASGSNFHNNAGANITETATEIHMNGPVAAIAGSAESAMLSKIPLRVPQKEPWAGHENYDPVNHVPDKTDNDSATSVRMPEDPEERINDTPRQISTAGQTFQDGTKLLDLAAEKQAALDPSKKSCNPLPSEPVSVGVSASGRLDSEAERRRQEAIEARRNQGPPR